jgi:hypothetical protein
LLFCGSSTPIAVAKFGLFLIIYLSYSEESLSKESESLIKWKKKQIGVGARPISHPKFFQGFEWHYRQ